MVEQASGLSDLFIDQKYQCNKCSKYFNIQVKKDAWPKEVRCEHCAVVLNEKAARIHGNPLDQA